MQVVLEMYCQPQALSHVGIEAAPNTPTTQQSAAVHECAATRAAEPSPVSVVMETPPPLSSSHVEHLDPMVVKRAHPDTTAEIAPSASPAQFCAESTEARPRIKKPRAA